MSETPRVGKKRRARGDGGVHWDPRRERYVAERTVGYDTRGKRIVRKGSGTSESAALRALAKRVKDYEAGLVLGSEHYRIRQAVDDWLDHGQGDADSATVKRYRSLAKNHITPHLGGRKLRDLRADEVDAWLAGLAPLLATSTLGLVKWCLSKAVTRAVKRGYADRNVVDLCKTPRGQAGRPSKSLTLEEAKRVLTKTRPHRMHAYIVVSLLTGIRTEEVRALRWDRVHLDSSPPHIEVWRSVRSTGDTKTEKSRRTLALPALVVSRLQEHRVRQNELRLKAKDWNDAGLVFPTTVGTEMSANNAIRDFRAALRLVPGLDPAQWTPRELRHSFVSVLSASGVSVEQIADLVGHRGTRTTELVYRHQLKPVIQTGATVMDTLFSIPTEGRARDA